MFEIIIELIDQIREIGYVKFCTDCDNKIQNMVATMNWPMSYRLQLSCMEKAILLAAKFQTNIGSLFRNGSS